MAALPRLTNSSYNFAPQPQGGGTAFGQRPGVIAPPPSTYTQTANVMPGLPNLTQTAGQDVQSELQGQLSPGTVNFLQDKAAQFGISMGMPGMGAGGFGSNQFLRNLGMSSEGLSHQGVQDYNSLLPTVASTQLQPGLEYEVANQNALNAAAPDPRMAAQEQLKLMQDAYNMENPSGGNVKTEEIPIGPNGQPLKNTSNPPSWFNQHLYA